MNQSTTLTIPLSAQTLATIGLLALVLILSALVYWTVPSSKKAPDLHQAIDRLGLNTVHPLIAYLVSLIWLAIFGALLYGIFYIIVDVLQRSHASDIEGAKDLRWSLLSFTAITAALGAVVTLPLTLIRTRQNARQTDQNARQTDVAEQGHITDRITKAVEGLGAEKTVKRQRKNNKGKFVFEKTDDVIDYSKPVMEEVTEPNLEVRIGALFALERISQDSDRDHVNVMEILCAYIRNNADRNSPTLPDEEPEEGWRAWGEANRTQLPLDVDIALKIIERRDDTRKAIEKQEGYRLGLERAPMYALDLAERELVGAFLFQAKFQGTNLWNANLKECYLGDTEFSGANLLNANLQGANLVLAEFQDANLYGTEMQGSYLMLANFDRSTSMDGANFDRAYCMSVDFSETSLTQERLQTAFGDGSTILPGSHGPETPTWPTHWPKEATSWHMTKEKLHWSAERYSKLDNASDDDT